MCCSCLQGLQGYSPVKVDDDALVTLISLLRVSSPLVKQHLQRLFLNLCEDKATMESTLRILLSLLRAPLSADEARAARQEPKQQLTQPASLSAALQVLHTACQDCIYFHIQACSPSATSPKSPVAPAN